jgi:hypothetical protein
MKGQVFTVAKIHYVNGVVYFTAQKGKTSLKTLAEHYQKTTKSGDVKHPLVRVRTLARLAEGLGLLTISKDKNVLISDLGKAYTDARLSNKWSLSKEQKELLGNYILSDHYRTETIYSITTLFRLYKSGYRQKQLARQFAIEIGKDKAWKSDVTYEGFTKFGLDYIKELGLMEIDDRDLLLKTISIDNKYQEKVNDVQPIGIPDGKLPRPKPKKYGNSEKYHSNPRRSKNSLIAASFKCEFDNKHTTFINKKTKRQYMEAHHLLPMSAQKSFEYDIDIPENILCLCPNCHRKIHLAENIARREILTKAYNKRKNKLVNRGINIDFNKLANFYGIK